MANTQVESDRARAMLRNCLASAFRTALACTIVGGATLFGPKILNREVAFPALSYVTVILIVTDATLGDTIRGCWLAFYASLQVICPAILTLWLIGPARLNNNITAALVAITGFFVALPENTHLISKRIALGQIVIVYVIGFINGAETEPVMHPIHVAASTAVGVFACVLALLVPYPSLAYCEVKNSSEKYIENASERLKLYVKAFCADDNTLPKTLISRSKSLNKAANKLLRNIISKQESMQWEIFPIKFFIKSYNENPGQTFQNVETILRGMENALSNCSEFPVRPLSSELKDELMNHEDQLLNKVKSMALIENTITPQSDEEMGSLKFPQTLHITNNTSYKDLPSFFFLFCLKLLRNKPEPTSSPDVSAEKTLPKSIWSKISIIPITVNRKRLMPALKCSLSLGFAVLFGLIYSKENGFWSGLPVAISLAAAREATFKVSNIKAQGTVLGTVYGVIGCFVFERYVKIRFISLLPWFVFSSFLRQSKMYGQAGGISAVIGAVLILGRKNFGSPSDFAIERIVETFIGLSCSIMVDILLQPTRAAVLAKAQLATCLEALHDAVGSITLGSTDISLEERVNKLKFNVNELGKSIEEAEVEPNFWFLPFHSACFNKLKVSLSKMLDLLLFGSYALRFLEQESEKMDDRMWQEGGGKLENDLKLIREVVCSGIKCFKEVSTVESLALLEKEFEKRKDNIDLEMGKPGRTSATQWPIVPDDEDEMKKNVFSFLHNMDELVSEIGVEENGNVGVKNEMILSLSAVAFCMNGLLKETKEIEKAIKEVVQWENPSGQVDLSDILCKLRAVKKNM